MNLKTLDTVIAMIIVILILSLIVQSIQSVIKKWFKLKSRSILDSLHDLFEYAQLKEMSAKEAAESAEKLVERVKEELKLLGRVSLIRKNAMVDSIAKEDLLKILDRIDSTGLKAKVDQWYETVMQGFEERYTRHMKTVAIFISIFVVIFFNANFFDVYQNISRNDLLRNSLIAQTDDINKRLRELPPQNNQAPPEDRTQRQQAEEELKQARQQLQLDMDRAAGLGFKPLTKAQVSNFFSGNVGFLEVLRSLLGWTIMVMLLSVGAPFWQDALESLFGIKNLLRKKSDTKNVEDTGGQPRT
jgi:hypothetical protein